MVRRWWTLPVRPLSVVAVVALLVAPGLAAAEPSSAGVGLEHELRQLEDDQARAEREVAALREREGDARERLDAIVAELDEATIRRAHTRAELDQARKDRALAIAEAELARQGLDGVLATLQVTEERLADRQRQLEARIRAAFKYGNASFLEAFVGVKDIADFLNSNTYVASVLDGDRQLVEDVVTLLGQVEEQRAHAAQLRTDAERQAQAALDAETAIDAALQRIEALTATIDARRVEQQATLRVLADDRAAAEAHLIGLEVESRRIGDQLAAVARQQAEEEARRAAEAAAAARAEQERLQAERAAQRERDAEQERAVGEPAPPASAPVEQPSDGPASADPQPVPAPAPEGGWLRPVPGPVTSAYGPRWGRQHQGVDFGGAVGTVVAASAAGTVVGVVSSCAPMSSPGCAGGYGNHVIVAHPGGMATLYAHLSTVAVGSGQQVAAGQVIGAIGNSGNSTGPHLHFEVREAGVPRQPCAYVRC